MNSAIRPDPISIREEGRGVPVLLLHGSLSDSRQWRSLTGYLGGRHRVMAPDLPGYGRTRAAPHGASSLAALAERLRSMLVNGGPAHVVGHSFGGAVALKAASLFPGYFRSLTLIEPAAFGSLWTERGRHIAETHEFRAAAHNSATALVEGDAWSAAGYLIDFWNGEGAWGRTSFRLQQAIAAKVGQAHGDFAALDGDTTTAADLAGVVCPILSIRGTRSPAATDTIAHHLRQRLPFFRDEEIEGAGHMVPLTDPHIVDPMIGDFLARVDRTWQDESGSVTLAA
jgi:pimeloyl-ACP methyl ester carboxylesterase